VINTKDIRGDVDRALPIRVTYCDYRGTPTPLTSPAVAYAAVLADAKVPALFTLSSADTLDCSTLGAHAMTTVLGGQMVSNNVGLPITVRLVGDASSVVTLDAVNNDVTIHYKAGVSTVAQVEAAIIASPLPLSVITTGVGATVLGSGDFFIKTLVTAIVLLEQTTYPGQYVVTFVRDRTKLLMATGDDDPYLWESSVVDANGQPYSTVSRSRMSMFPATPGLPS
jgi:hypothetical protein